MLSGDKRISLFAGAMIVGAVFTATTLKAQTGALPAPGATQSAATAPAAVTAGQSIEQAGGTRVHGTVTDPDGALIPGASAIFTPQKGNGKSVKTAADGTYAITLNPGTYAFVVSMPGFATYSVLNLRVPAVPATTLDVKLRPGAEETIVNVDADSIALSVDADSNASSQVISGKDLEALSDDPDELQSELQALAGPSAGPNGGQIYVDGFTGGTLPPKSSIREIRVNQNPFSAQYDRLGYGRIEVFTKPGTDKIHGSLQVNGNPSQFNSGNPLIPSTTQQPDYHTIFAFGSLTGPISKTASYSLGGSYRNIQDNAFTNAPILAASAGSTTLCAPGQVGCVQTQAQISTNTPQSRYEITPRFDLALGAKNVLTMRFQYTKNDETNQGIGNLALPQAAFNAASNEAQIQISDTQTFSSKLINETRFEYERSRSANTPNSNAPTVTVLGSFTSGGSGGQNSSDHEDHIEVQNYTSLALAKNFIRFGGRLRSTREAQNTYQGTNGIFTYNSLVYVAGTGVDHSYATGTPSQFTGVILNPGQKIDFTFADLGLYLEDDWKVRPNLSVSYGIRYETQNHLADHHDFAPRVSVSYGIGKGTPKTVLRGGFGMFYDRFGQGSILTLNRLNGTFERQYVISNPTTYNGSTCSTTSTNAVAACTAGASSATQAVYSTASGLRTPYIIQEALGADRTLGKIGTLSVNYLHSQGVHQLATQNIAYNYAAQQATGVQYQFFSGGVFQQNQLILNSRVSISRKVSLFGYYQFGHVNGDTSGNGSFESTPGNLAADYGRTTFDVRQRVFLGGSVTLPKAIQFSPFMIGQSGNPYNVTTGVDVNNDTQFNDRPLLVDASLANPAITNNPVKTIAGCGTFAPRGTAGTAGAPIAPINECTGPALFTFNFRLTKTFGFGGLKNGANDQAQGQGGPGGGGPPPGGGRGGGGGGRGGPGGGGFGFGGGGSSTAQKYNVALGINVQNLFNNENLATPNGTLTSRQFGQSTQLTGGPYTTNSALRRLSLQASFNF